MNILTTDHRRYANAEARALLFGLLLAAQSVSACQTAGASPAVIEPMELQGSWLGMRMVATESTTSRDLGVPAGIEGVVVAALPKAPSSRAAQAGVLPGDVLVAVDGTRVMNLADLYALTKGKSITQAIAIDVLRQGQPIALTLAASLAPTDAPAAPEGTARNAVQPAASGAPLFCPADGTHWLPAQVGPELRCPRCGGPLMR